MHNPLPKSVFVACGLLLIASAWAQNQPAKPATVQFSDPSRPGTVKVSLVVGNLKIKGYEGRDVAIVAPGRAGLNEGSPSDLKMVEADNIVTVSPGLPGSTGSLELKVPLTTVLKLNCTAGDIAVENVAGEIEVSGQNASLTLTHVSGVVMAHSLNGRIVARMDQVPSEKAISFSTLNGDIDVSLPANTRATVRLQTENGSLHNDFKMESATSSGSRPPKRITGKINGGGADILIKTLNGSIHLRKTPETKPPSSP